MELDSMTDEELDDLFHRTDLERTERRRKHDERAKRFHDALPATLGDYSGFSFEKSVGGHFLMMVMDDRSGQAELPWSDWVEFAHRIINADRDARIAAAQDDGRRIEAVYGFANGMTAVFDQHGEQMPEFQGQTAEVMPRIRAAGWEGIVAQAEWPR